MKASFISQLKVLLWRNFLIRSRLGLIMELVCPLFYVGFFISTKDLMKPAVKPPMSFPVSQLQDFSVDHRKTLFVVSNNISGVVPLMRHVAAFLSTTYQLFETEGSALEAYLMNSTKVSAGIVFGYQRKGNIFSYAIRMPGDLIASTQSLFTNNTGLCRDGNPNGTSAAGGCRANSYLQTGFAYLQYVIDQALLQQLNVTAPLKVSIQMMPKGKYISDLNTLQAGTFIHLTIAYSSIISSLTTTLVVEKEKRIKDGMMMMGLRSSIFWLSWALFDLAVVLVVTSGVTLILASGKLFENSNMFIVWLILMLYGLSNITLAFLASHFFKNAMVAGFVVQILEIIITFSYLVVQAMRTVTADGYSYRISPAARWVMCLLSPLAMASAIDTGIFLDAYRGGMTFDTMTLGDFPLFAPLLMLFVDTMLYHFLAVYLDHIISAEYGPRYKPWYFLQKSYWFPRRRDRDEEAVQFAGITSDAVSGPNIEPASADMHSKCQLRMRNILKVFPGKETVIALSNLTLDMYEGQITALLGHNGAGKTTLLNMLTGVIPPTSGTAYIYGLDISQGGDVEEIRSMCGICPQHNMLYDQLSASEHLIIFAGIKGVASDQVESEVTKVLKSVDLYDQKDVIADKLSGGQKRKLSVAIALIGDPKILFLDEPTAGMDPSSRRFLWSLLKNSKEGRLIVLTTHFMDEADILADRKAIISKGQLKCCGSSLFLKNKYGIGYHLNMIVEPHFSLQAVTSLLNQHVTGAQFQRCHGMELSFTIPTSEVTKFSGLFQALEAKNDSGNTAKSFGILSYGVSMPTLEEVFLKLGEEKEEKKDVETTLYENQSYQMFSKPNNIHVRDVASKRHEDQMEIGINRRIPSLALSQITVESQRSAAVFRALLKLRFLLAFRSKSAFIFTLLIPVLGIFLALITSKEGESAASSLHPAPMHLTAHLYSKFLVLDSVSNKISDSAVKYLNETYKVDIYRGRTVNVSDVSPHDLGVNLLTTSASNLASYTALYNDSAYHSLPAVINAMSMAVLRTAGDLTHDISTFSLPWQNISRSHFNEFAFSSTYLMGPAFTIVASYFSVSVVEENQWKCKSQLRIAGASFHMYWGTMLLFSILVYLIPTLIFFLLAQAMAVASLTTTGATIMLVILFIVFIPEYVLMSLIFSFFIHKLETAYGVLPVFLPTIGLGPYVIVASVDMLTSEKIATALHYLFVFIDPVYIIFGGFYYIEKVYRVSQFTHMDPKIGDYFKFSNNIIICLIAGLYHMLVMYLLLRVLEVHSMGGSLLNALRICHARSVDVIKTTNMDVIQDEDDDVKQERQRVDEIESRASGEQTVVAFVKNIRKVYTKFCKICATKKTARKVKVAVRNLSFAVNKGEVFGLLGPNGAGKTTALSIMTADTTPTRGKVVVAGHCVQAGISSSFVPLGFCPQYDPMWEMLTLKEHLELYAAIKCIPRAEISTVINYFIDNLKLQEHQNKKVKQLSGGTKRKLSYAISMLGDLKVVLLDEPSTGMDPQSKRFLWDTINSSFVGQDRGAILTTHYMEEADALCTRVAIMVNGQMECLGPTQHLKSKYGGGYLLEIKLSESSTATREDLEARLQKLERHLVTLFPGATCLESFAERAQYRIPQTDVEVLSSTFTALEETKRTHGVEEYSFSQSTLEQVFLNFAKKQIEEGDDEETARAKGYAYRKLSDLQPSMDKD